jgi:hypothetical protein
MKKILLIIGGVLLVLLLSFGVYYFVYYAPNQKVVNTGNETEPNNSNVTGTKSIVVRSDFTENFRDGKIDEWWTWNNANNDQNLMNIDYVREELSIKAAPLSSQWTNDDTGPVLSFKTDKDFVLETEYVFDPRADFQHGGMGLIDTNSKEWIRISRSYDTHALQGQYDIANNLYVMEKRIGEGIIKYNHANYLDSLIYAKMQKKSNEVIFSYSRDGVKWEELDRVQKTDLSKEVEVYLFAYSTANVPVEVVFKNISFSVLN